jgi:chemotaxis protein methyltransferase CheR
MTTVKMTEEEYHLFNELLSNNYGIYFAESKREFLETRLKPRLDAFNLQTYMEYYYLIQYNTDGNNELQNIARLVTNNETYFFRETHQFEVLFDHAIDDLKAHSASKKIIRFLIAGCSTGEEPYTLNIFAKENQYQAWGYSFVIDAFDIDTDALQIAKDARYKKRSLRFMDEEKISKYFKRCGKDYYEIKDMYRSGVTFNWGNILRLDTYQSAAPYDVVFCRNVTIYFSEPALHKAVENFAQCLRPGGLLFLGYSESIIGISRSFESVRLGNCIIYKRIDP